MRSGFDSTFSSSGLLFRRNGSGGRARNCFAQNSHES